jgi:hypothetical protein
MRKTNMATRKIIAEMSETPKETFETSSKDLVIGLLSLGHKPYRVESAGRIIFYKFDRKKVSVDVNRILTGEDVQISYHKSMAASSLWAMILTRANELNSA